MFTYQCLHQTILPKVTFALQVMLPALYVPKQEWQVFAALQFRLHATPSQVAFHFKRCMKALDWNARTYLGTEMYEYWQDAIEDEEYRNEERKVRQEARKERKEQQKLIQIQREIDAANRRESLIEKDGDRDPNPSTATQPITSSPLQPTGKPSERAKSAKPQRQSSRIGGMKLLHRFAGGKRAMSTDKLVEKVEEGPKLTLSPSMPALSDSFNQADGEDYVVELKSDSPPHSGQHDEDKHGDSHSVGTQSDEGIKF